MGPEEEKKEEEEQEEEKEATVRELSVLDRTAASSSSKVISPSPSGGDTNHYRTTKTPKKKETQLGFFFEGREPGRRGISFLFPFLGVLILLSLLLQSRGTLRVLLSLLQMAVDVIDRKKNISSFGRPLIIMVRMSGYVHT